MSNAIAFDLDEFRADFALVWKHWIDLGDETQEAYRAASRWVQETMHDAAQIVPAANDFKRMAGELRASFQRDRERSARIKAEVRAERAANKGLKA